MSQLRDDKLIKKIAVVLIQLRVDKELTQEDVFDETKIHIGRIETAKSNLTVSTLSKLCEYYKISLKEFHAKVENVN